MDGKVQTYKARLIAKGYRQRQGVDFDETFSPLAMIKSIRIMLAIVAYHDGNLQEEMYMTQLHSLIGICKKKCT